MRVSSAGEKASQFWMELPTRYPDVELDECAIMPNYLHGIILINGDTVGAIHEPPLENDACCRGGS